MRKHKSDTFAIKKYVVLLHSKLSHYLSPALFATASPFLQLFGVYCSWIFFSLRLEYIYFFYIFILKYCFFTGGQQECGLIFPREKEVQEYRF